MNGARLAPPLFCAAFMLLVIPGCLTRPTVDVTKAPFKASTDLSEAPFRASSELTNGTSQATADLTKPTKDFISSTSPSSWFTGDGTLKAEHKVLAFAVFNFENLKDNMAQGYGEYLASLATLIGVPADQQADFFKFAQETYPVVYAEGTEPIESVHRLLREMATAPRYPAQRLVLSAS